MRKSVVAGGMAPPGSESREQFSYKFQRLREEIRRAIGAGELTGRLPGERQLARRFGANSKTVNKALADLSAEGVITRVVGRGTFVAGQEHRAPRGGGRGYLWLAPDSLEGPFLEAMYEMARGRVEQYGHRLHLEVAAISPAGGFAPGCLQPRRLRALSGVVFFSAAPDHDLLCDLHRRRMHMVLCNTAPAALKVDRVTADYAVGGFELTEHFALLGYTRIRLLVERPGGAAAQAQRGYHTALRRHHLEPQKVHCWEGGAAAELEALISGDAALLCLGAGMSADVKRCLVKMGRLLPQDASIAVLTTPGELAAQQELITSYDVYPDHLLDWAVQLLFDAAIHPEPREVLVPGVFNDRGSTGACRTPASPAPLADVVI